MSTTSERAYPPPGVPPGQPRHGKDDRASPGGGVLRSLAILAGSLVVGLAGGVAWASLAPRAVYEVVGRGSADVVNPETSAFIAADAWYCLIGVIGGLAIGLAGYLLAVRRYGPVPMAAVLAGSAAAGITARYVGERQGLGRFDHLLLTARTGTLLHAPLALAGDTSAVFWPPRASLPAVAFWPLAACLVAGGIAAIRAMRERSAARHAGPSPGDHPGQFAAYPGR